MSTIDGGSHKAIKFFHEKPAALPVYWIYCARRNHDGVAYPSVRGLAHDTGWSVNPCREARDWLVEHGALAPVADYVRPEWRKLAAADRTRRMNLDKSEYFRITGVINIGGKTYDMLYAPARDAGEDSDATAETTPPDESAHDVSPDDTSDASDVSRHDVSPAPTSAVDDHAPGDTELDSIKELGSKKDELNTTTTLLGDALQASAAPVVVVSESDQCSWAAAFHQLELQDPASFDTWLRGARLLAVEDVQMAESFASAKRASHVFVIGVRNSYARDMLQNRLYRSVRRVLNDVRGMTDNPVELRFEVVEPEPPKAGPDMPLFRQLASFTASQFDTGSTPTDTIRNLYAQYIGEITPGREDAVKWLEATYSYDEVAVACDALAAKRAAGRVDRVWEYFCGILRKQKASAS